MTMSRRSSARACRRRSASMVALVAAVGAALAAAGCGGDGATDAERLRSDPVALARFYGEAAATCDLAHARLSVLYGAGWTAYVPGGPDPAADRDLERRARAALEACRAEVEPGSRIEARLRGRDGASAVVEVRTVAPSGAASSVRMRFVNLGHIVPSLEDRWVRRD